MPLIQQSKDVLSGLHLALLWREDGLTLDQLSRKARVPYSTLSRARHLKAALDREQAKRVAAVLGVREAFLAQLIAKACLREPLRAFWEVA